MHSITPFVRSVAAVKACRRKIWDLLTLKSDHTLSILTFEGSELNIDFSLNDSLRSRVGNPTKSPVDVSMQSDADISMSSSIGSRPRVVALRDSIVSNVILELENGDKARLHVNLSPSDPLVESVMVVLASSLKHDHFPRIWTEFLRIWNSNHYSVMPDIQFDCLAKAVLNHWGMGWISAENPASTPTSPWDDMLSSTQHFRLQDDPALSHIVPPTKSPSALPTYRSLTKSERNSLHILLAGLHVLGEELRLLHYEHESLLRLSSLTVRLAQIIRPGFFDLLKRMYPSSASGWKTGTE
jgi:anaphase-promoting complex subunit 1